MLYTEVLDCILIYLGFIVVIKLSTKFHDNLANDNTLKLVGGGW